MAYINKRELEKIISNAPKGVSSSLIIQGLVKKGHTIQGYNDKENLSFGRGLVKGVAEPFVRGWDTLKTSAPVLGATLGGLPAAVGIGDKEKARERITRATEKAEQRQKEQIKTRVGTYSPVTSPKEAAGVGLQLSSWFGGGGAAKQVASKLVRGRLGQAMLTGATSGAIYGGVYGAGSGLAEDKTATGVAGDTAIGAVGGAVFGGALSGAGVGGSILAKQVSKKAQPIAQQVRTKVVDKIYKAIKPRMTNLNTNQLKNVQNKQVQGFKVLLDNKQYIKLLDEAGMKVSRLPKTLSELSESIQSVKTNLFSKYDKLARESGERGAFFNPIDTISSLNKMVKDKSYSPQLRNYAKKMLDEVKELKGEGPAIVQNRIRELNESLAGYYAGRVEKGTARIDASIANKLRSELDDLISDFGGRGWKQLRSDFAALKSIESDVNRQAIIQARKASKGLVDLTDVFTGGDLMSGILTLDPTRTIKGAAGKAIQSIYKHINSPEKHIKDIFKLLDNPKLKPKPLPKGKGEILRTTQKTASKTIKDATSKITPEIKSFLKDAYNKAPQAKKEIDTLAKNIADKYGGVVATTGLKKEDKVIRNILNKYSGDYTKVTDIARNTIVTKKPSTVFKDLIKGENVYKYKHINPKTDPLGYSGYNVKVKTSNGMISEIQINTPEMIYAKEKAKDAITQLGKDVYSKLNIKYKGIGGQGHMLYDRWTRFYDAGNSRSLYQVEQRSIRYYNKFR